MSKTFFGFKLIASFARFAGIPSIVARLITSRGPLVPQSESVAPDERMMLFPPVMRMTSRAFERKFWR